MAQSKSRVRKIKGALLLIGILVLGSVVGLFITHQRKASIDQSGSVAAIKQKAAISLGGVRHWAVKGGVKEWSLEAESADYGLEDNEVVFKKLKATFFREEKDPVFLSAPSGTWHTDSNDLDVYGHVMIKNKEHELRTEKLTYIHKSRTCVTRSPVTITGEALHITADNMRYDLGRNFIHLSGNVIIVIDEDIGL